MQNPQKLKNRRRWGVPKVPMSRAAAVRLRSLPPASQYDCTSKKKHLPLPTQAQELPSLSTLPCGSLAKMPSPAVSLRLGISPAQSPS